MKSSSKFVASLFAGSALASPAFAQLAPPAPIHQSVDQNGVNLFDGNLYVNGPVLSMGQSDPQVSNSISLVATTAGPTTSSQAWTWKALSSP